MRNFVVFLLVFGIFRGFGGNFVVTNTNDGGSGSLRSALQMSAATAGPHTITFNIPTSDVNYDAATGVWVIAPQSTLPMIMQANVTVDGASQALNQGETNPHGPEIVLDGQGRVDYALRVFNASSVIVKCLNIRRFTKGVQLYNAPDCIISGNYIGTNETGSDTLGNDIGIEIGSGSDRTLIGGSIEADRNLISGNRHIGVRLLDVQHCTVSGNFVGIDRTGTYALPNYDGVSLEGAVKYNTIGGLTAGERNVISGNIDYGLPIFGAGAEGNSVIGNYLGTNASGTYAIGNTYGVLFDDGTFNNRVGGESDAERNLISGNSGYGVFFYNNGTNHNLIKNNLIGTDVTGIQAIPNTAGIVIDGISYQNTIDSNVIAGNLEMGIGIDITGSDSNVIVRNRIGVALNGSALPNGMDGIRISQGPVGTAIGGSPAEANIIANNGGNGVFLMSDNCRETFISCNSFYDNGGLAIDLFPYGVTPNDAGDADDGPNGGLNFPVLTSVTYDAMSGAHQVEGTLEVAQPADAVVQLYLAAVDVSGFGEGRIFLASITPDAAGHWSTSVTGQPVDGYFTALTIDAEHNTSEFSRARNISGLASVIVESPAASFLSVSPNPTSSRLVIQGADIQRVALFNSLGERLREYLVGGTTCSQVQIDLSDLPAGMYVLQVLSQGVVVTKKVVKW